MPGSEAKYCSPEHSKLARSQKMSKIGASFDTAHARSFKDINSIEKQRTAMLRKFGINKPGPEIGWFDKKDEDFKDYFRRQLAEMDRSPTPKIAKTGHIFKYGLRFDAKVELFFYEDMIRRGIYTERLVLFNGWSVDFNLPEVPTMVEVKSWYTAVSQQGVHDVVSKIDPKILLVEEYDAYGLRKVDEDPMGYLAECSDRFKTQLIQMMPDSAP